MSSDDFLSNDSDSESENEYTETSLDSDSDTVIYQCKKLRFLTDSSDDNSQTVQCKNEILQTETFTNKSKIFIENSGPKNAPSPDSKPIAYFNLFFTTPLLEAMAEETNQCAQQYMMSVSFKPMSRANKWTPTTALEMKAFIAVLLEMSITRRATIYSYWTQNSRCIPWFDKMFPKDRFALLLRFFHLVDKRALSSSSDPNYNPCARFEPLVNHANTVFRFYYMPHLQLESNKEKPLIIHDYNKFMRGVDETDKMLYAYLDERRTLKYWKKVAFNIFGRMVLHAYVLYASNVMEKKMCRLKFTSEIIEYIEKEWSLQKDAVEPPAKKFVLEKLPGLNLRKCVVCSSKEGGIKRSRLICSLCKKGLHGICAHKHNC